MVLFRLQEPISWLLATGYLQKGSYQSVLPNQSISCQLPVASSQ